MALVNAIWNGPFVGETPTGLLTAGDLYTITEEEFQSGHWLDPAELTPPPAQLAEHASDGSEIVDAEIVEDPAPTTAATPAPSVPSSPGQVN